MRRRLKSPRQEVIDSLEPRVMLSSSPVIIGYLPDYEFSHLSSIDLAALTQVNYFAISASSTGSLAGDTADGYTLSQNEAQIQTLVTEAHSENPRVDVSVTIDPSSAFQAIASSSSATSAFISNILAFCSTYHLDGIDLDYEPGNGSLSQSQITAWGNFLATLHAQTSANGLILSEAVQVSPPYIIPTADLSDIDRYMVMDYDLLSNSSAPYGLSLTYLQGWANYGVPKADLYMGVPFYGQEGSSWSDPTETYEQIVTSYAAANGGAYPSPSLDTLTIGGVTWGFNGVDTVQEKTQYVINNGYGGIMIWEMGQDNFSGNGYGSQALLPAIVSTLGAATETWTGNVSTAWNTPGNWQYDEVPGSTTNIVINGGTPVISSPLDGGSITINGGTLSFATSTGVSIVSSLVVNSGATVNLANNTLLIDYGSGADPIAAIYGYLENGYNNGSWNGPGIDSSAAASNSSYALGFADGKEGVVANLTSGEIEVAYTLYGDTNLDGTVNGSDFSSLAANFGLGVTNWDQGNFTHGSAVNGSDFSLLAANFGLGASGAALVLPSPAVVSSIADPVSFGTSLVAASEPASSSQSSVAAIILTDVPKQIITKKHHHG
jgi:chitinase